MHDDVDHVRTYICEQFLPQRDYVTFGYLLSEIRLWQTDDRRQTVCRRSVVCLSNVRAPHSGIEAFGNISSPPCTLAVLWPPCKILWRSSRGNPSAGGVKRERGSKMVDIEGYLINGTRYCLGTVNEEFTGVTFNNLDLSVTRISRSSEFSVVNSTEIAPNIQHKTHILWIRSVC